MAQLLLELRSEEIPAGMQARAAEDLARLVGERLKEAGLSYTDADAFVTPRRLALVVKGLPTAQPDVTEERRGPRVDAPPAAIQGFLMATGLTLDRCEKRETPKGTFYFASIHRKGRSTAKVLPEALGQALGQMSWPKSMRWGAHAIRWVRPLRGIVCLFNGAVIPIALGPVTAGDSTAGHRVHAPKPITVTDFADYKTKLRAAKVMLDPAERRETIRRGAERLATDAGLVVKDDKGLLDEVAGLVEWPVALMGRIDESFMDLPPEVLATAMRRHQRYFSTLAKKGTLAPRFILVANIEAPDGGKAIVAGNERVLSARLADARYFWDRDRKAGLQYGLNRLDRRTYYEGLGTMDHKAQRIVKLAGQIGCYLNAGRELAERAGLLCKADLSTEMVGEFPELQGVMGRYYALHGGEKPEVAEAIGEHYAPQGPNDRCPTAPISIAVALADKIDALFWFFQIGQRPTGSKDPLALRRAALGVIRLIVENKLRLSLREVFKEASSYGPIEGSPESKAKTTADLLDFFADRLKAHLRDKGVRHDLVAAVFAAGRDDDLVRLLARVEALRKFLSTDDGASLLVAYWRGANIVAIEEKKDKTTYDGGVDPNALVEPEEKSLHEGLEDGMTRIQKAVKDEKFGEAMSVLHRLKPLIDAFFEKVMVNSEDKALRANRLRLLSRIRSALGGVADFSKIEG